MRRSICHLFYFVATMCESASYSVVYKALICAELYLGANSGWHDILQHNLAACVKSEVLAPAVVFLLLDAAQKQTRCEHKEMFRAICNDMNSMIARGRLLVCK